MDPFSLKTGHDAKQKHLVAALGIEEFGVDLVSGFLQTWRLALELHEPLGGFGKKRPVIGDFNV